MEGFITDIKDIRYTEELNEYAQCIQEVMSGNIQIGDKIIINGEDDFCANFKDIIGVLVGIRSNVEEYNVLDNIVLEVKLEKKLFDYDGALISYTMEDIGIFKSVGYSFCNNDRDIIFHKYNDDNDNIILY